MNRNNMSQKPMLRALLSLMSATALGTVLASPAIAAGTDELEALIRAQAAEITALRQRVEALEKSAPVAIKAPDAINLAPKSTATEVATHSAEKTVPAEQTIWKGAPQFKSRDGAFSFKPRGRIHVDSWAINSRQDGIDYASGTEVRRGRLGAEGQLFTDFGYMIEVDFAGNSVSYQDVYLSYALSPATTLIAGYHKPPIALEDQTSDNYVTFMERALYATSFAPGRGTGLSATWTHPQGMVMFGVWGEGESDSRDSTVDEDWNVSARATYVPWKGADGLLHLGVSGYYLKAGNDAPRFRMRERPETHLAPTLVDSGALTVDDVKFAGLEAALIQGPFHASAEWGWQWIDRSDAAQARFDGGYAQIGWFLTGESRPYGISSGTFGRVKPKRSLGDGGPGAFELAVRYSTLDLEDADIMGGVEKNWTLGLNWYANPYMRLMFNYVRFDVDRSFATRPLSSPDHKGDAFGMRAQIDW